MAKLTPIEAQKRLGTIRGELPLIGKKHTLSVCMIVKNEEANIERAIRSFLPFADEIIVNDTGSTDRTVEICQSLPKTKVIHSEWIRDFSYSRNLSLEQATSAWCLWMDADDVVPPEQVPSFLKLKMAPRDRAFGFQVINTQAGLPVGAHFLQIRMFPNHPQIRFERAVHEQVYFSLASLGLHILYLETSIWHTGYESEALRRKKAERNLDLILNEPDRGIDPIVSIQIGDSYAILDRFDEAIEGYSEALHIPDIAKNYPEVYQEALINLAKEYGRKKDIERCVEYADRAIAVDPLRIDPYFRKGENLFLAQRIDDAEPCFEKLLSLKKTHSGQASHWDVMRMYSFNYLCDIAMRRKDYALLLKRAERFQKEYPQVVEAPLLIGKAYLGLGQASEAALFIEKSIGANPTANREAWFALMMAYEKSGEAHRIVDVRRRMAEAYGEKMPAPGSPLLSIAMIVKNEEKYLKACLDSVQGLWNELVVVDTGSTDSTVSIAEAAGARVVHFPWIDDFSAARNRSLEECHGEWILWLDADDVVLPEDREQIRSLVSTQPPSKAFSFVIKNSQDGGITGPVFNQIRLFPNRPEIRFEGRVHEQVTQALERMGIPYEFLALRIVHTGYTDPETVKAKQRRNLELMQVDIEKSPRTVNAMKYFSLGNAYLDLGEPQTAADWYRRSMEQAERVGEDRHILDIIPVKLAECRANQGFQAEALAMIAQYLASHPVQPNALYLSAQLNETLGYREQAALQYGKLMHYQEQKTMMPVDYQQLRIRAGKFLADFWLQQGLQQLALEVLRMGVAIGKGQLVPGLKLASLYFEHERYAQCRDNLIFARQLEESPSMLLMLCQCHVLLDEITQAFALLKEAIGKYPQDAGLRELQDALKADLGIA